MLDTNSIPLLSKDVITRRDSNGVLLFQVRTDEMHFLSENAFALLKLCDGSRTLSEIEEVFFEFQPESAMIGAKTDIEGFLESLVIRRVLEVWS